MPLIQRHYYAAWFVLTVVLPLILRTVRRPVIFSRFAGMGDIICTFSAALEPKKIYPQATFIYNCAASFACLPAIGGVTERVTHLQAIGLVGHWYRALLSDYYSFGSDDEQSARRPKRTLHHQLCAAAKGRGARRASDAED